ncbi:peptidoglycan D,D-transpeptidase FtsI family protein [Candidatus Venteria ishoeyi]|uniref:Peptidoglycan D,D-transpeptidase FtsI n=1 Tax=Candidatus Venteria ishoeyi TaxID=1899563 RepID=A0A1H6FEG6_9GAMM|nr:penicillin-binding protein 2 [Candidatus Venteria ishoeyi]SEH08437.1 Penicillin-binding protein 2 [Candidatus Venteria ishoeyi]
MSEGKVRRNHTSAKPRKTSISASATTLAKRHQWLFVFFILLLLALVWRIVFLQVTNKSFLQRQGDARLLRTITLPAHRGQMHDRHGQALAISTPVDSVWVDPQQVIEAQQQWPQLMGLLGKDSKDLEQLLDTRMQREFVYLQRHLNPQLAAQIDALNIPGVYLQREYRRYYPAAEVTAHVLGFTNIDDQGQEGLELAFEQNLRGTTGKRRVMQDRKGQVIARLQELEAAHAGQDLNLSLDRRLAYLAYRELRDAVVENQAKGGSVVILDVQTGEVLAMSNQPAYNPNNRNDLDSQKYRNRAVTDRFEPGSTIKPFTIAAALESGLHTADSRIQTGNGKFKIGRFNIHDGGAYGKIDLRTILRKSSNVGAAKVALSLPGETLWNLFYYAGFGSSTGSIFPGETPGHLPYFADWNRVDQASLGFGYGLSVSLLQLARAYAAIANQGRLPAINFLAQNSKSSAPQSRLIMQPETAQELMTMLEAVVSPQGTGKRAMLQHYRVAGKTGTARKTNHSGYVEDRYRALFVGIAPASQPKIVIAIMLDEPGGKHYYGGQIAAPIFAKIAKTALYWLNVPADKIK